jgi:hypothetical protein
MDRPARRKSQERRLLVHFHFVSLRSTWKHENVRRNTFLFCTYINVDIYSMNTKRMRYRKISMVFQLCRNWFEERRRQIDLELFAFREVQKRLENLVLRDCVTVVHKTLPPKMDIFSWGHILCNTLSAGNNAIDRIQFAPHIQVCQIVLTRNLLCVPKETRPWGQIFYTEQCGQVIQHAARGRYESQQ